MRIGLNNAQDFFALVVRRRWWVIGPFVALSCAVAVLTYVLPKTYVSETLILVRPRDVPQDFVKDLIAGTAQQRLRAIEQTVLSRTNLVQILREFGDKLPEFQRLNMDERVLKLHDQINIVFELERSNGTELPLSYFRIKYQNQNPELAQKIAEKLEAYFIDQDNRTRETQVFGTTDFFSKEVEKIQQQLNESEERLKQVKSSKQFELPDQRESNLRTLDRLGLDKKANVEALDRYNTLLLTLESNISQTPATIPKPVTYSPTRPRTAQDAQVEQYRKAQVEYEEAASKYKPIHPEVQAAKARLEKLKQQIPPEVLAAASSEPAADETESPDDAMIPNPLYQNLVGQLKGVKTELEIRQRERTMIEAEIGKYGRRVENTPQTEQDMADAVRQNEDLKKQSSELKDKLAQARLSQNLESAQKGSQFIVVDLPNYPLTPAKPNKLMVLLVGSFLSLLAAIGLAVGVDIARQRVWTQSQVEAYWGVPVLVDIPQILTDSDVAALRRKKLLFAASSVGAAAVWGICLYGVYLKHLTVLQILDPVLQKLVYK